MTNMAESKAFNPASLRRGIDGCLQFISSLKQAVQGEKKTIKEYGHLIRDAESGSPNGQVYNVDSLRASISRSEENMAKMKTRMREERKTIQDLEMQITNLQVQADRVAARDKFAHQILSGQAPISELPS